MTPSWLATRQEYDNSGSIDQDKLLHGHENRTSCCYEVVPFDCITASCGHDTHKLKHPFRGDYYTRDDLPCTVYAPEPALTYHTNCPKHRSYNEALDKAQQDGLLMENHTDQS